MIEKSIIFNSKNKSRSFKVNPENPFFKITRIEIPSISKGSTEIISSSAPKFILSYTIKDINKASSLKKIEGIEKWLTNQTEPNFEIDEEITWSADQRQINFDFTDDPNNDADVVVYYTQLDRKIDFKNPFDSFSKHLSLNDNVKILFSAPFGQGKTTFLNIFFEKHTEKYEVFKLYPVNYAVSHNEDIFKYIKAELLFQLLGKDIEFDKERFTYLETAPAYFKANVLKIISPFLPLIPKIGKSVSEIYEKLHNLVTKYLDYHKAIQINEKNDALEFIKELYEKEGSIFEDNFYTQLIRQLLEQHKQNHNKENILVIDDIDRMDPDHIFRLFNVFSANFDSQDAVNGYSNKFGFDKIILVCDYFNIKNLFTHRYGTNVAFNGYLGKYYSHSPYDYDNKKAMKSLTKEILTISGFERSSYMGNVIELIINDLIDTEQINLRDLLKLVKFKFYETINSHSNVILSKLKIPKSYLIYFNVIAFLEHMFDGNTILEKFEKCKSRITYRNSNIYNDLTEMGFIALIELNVKIETDYTIDFKGDSFKFKVEEKSNYPLEHSYYVPINIESVSGKNHTFNEKDFYKILILNTQKYIEY